MKLPPHRAGDLGQAPLDRHVDVLVAVVEAKLARFELGRDGIEAPEQLVRLVRRQHAGLGEHPDVGARLLDVVGGEAAVECDRRVQALEDGIRWLPESGHGGSVRRGLRGRDYQLAAIAPIWITSVMPRR